MSLSRAAVAVEMTVCPQRNFDTDAYLACGTHGSKTKAKICTSLVIDLYRFSNEKKLV